VGVVAAQIRGEDLSPAQPDRVADSMVTTPTTVSQGHTPTFLSELELLMAFQDAHQLENRLLSTRIERLVTQMREHGIPLPEEDPRLAMSDAEHLMACRKVVTTAYELLECAGRFAVAMDELRRFIGSGMEFVGQKNWRTGE